MKLLFFAYNNTFLVKSRHFDIFSSVFQYAYIYTKKPPTRTVVPRYLEFLSIEHQMRFIHQSIELDELYSLVCENRVVEVGKGARSAKYWENRTKTHVLYRASIRVAVSSSLKVISVDRTSESGHKYRISEIPGKPGQSNIFYSPI